MYASDNSREVLAAWATLASLRIPVNPLDVVEAFRDPTSLFQTSIDELRTRLAWTPRQLEKVATAPSPSHMVPVLERLEARGIRLVPITDQAYPALLRRISCPPAALWIRGELEALAGPYVAIVGARRATPYGQRVASTLARALAETGIGVTSGGAFGIDAAAHEGALAVGGRSIAVLGTGIDQDYPAAHRGLFERVSATGACLSEFAPSTGPRPENFPIRNRLISGLSLGVVVVEAGEKSGALITSRFALEQDREVFAVPGDVFSPLSVGPHRLIQSGARLVNSVEDILSELQPHLEGLSLRTQTAPKAPEPPVPLEPDAAALYACLDTTPTSVDSLVEKSQKGAARVLELLLELELCGAVTQLPGYRFVRRAS